MQSNKEQSLDNDMENNENKDLGQTIAIDILLDPDQKMLDSAKAYNQKLLQNFPDGFELDQNHQPHITLVQGFVNKDDIPAIEKELKRILKDTEPEKTELLAKDLYFIPHEQMGLAGITIEKKELMDIHSQVISMIEPFLVKDGSGTAFAPRPDGKDIMKETIEYVSTFIPKSSGENFNPHITIGMAHQDFLKKMMADPFPAFHFSIQSASIYQLGELGTAQKQLVRID